MVDWWIYLIIIAYILFCSVYFYAVFCIFAKKNKRNKCVEKFENILYKLFEKDLLLDEAISQLHINYNQLCEEISSDYKEIELLNIVIYRLDSSRMSISEKETTYEKKIKCQPQYREFIFSLYNFIDQNQPFSLLPDKEAALLNNINEAMLSNNPLLVNNLLKQLANEIKAKEKRYTKGKKQTVIATTISIVGIIFTVVFGILSLI